MYQANTLSQSILDKSNPPQKPLGENEDEMPARYPHLFEINLHVLSKLISFKNETLQTWKAVIARS